MRLFRIKEEEIISEAEDKVLAKIAIDKAKARVATTRNTRIVLVLLATSMIVIPIVKLMPQDISFSYRVILGIVIGALLAGVITILLSFRYPYEVKKEYEKELSKLKTQTKE